MFLHTHPYDPFLPPGADRLIVGTLPPPRFTTGELLEGDVNFCYGSRDGLLWPVLERVFQRSLTYEDTEASVLARQTLLKEHSIGVFDIVGEARREKIDATDLGMQQAELRRLYPALTELPGIKALLFTGGNSKNGPEYFFRRHLREFKVPLESVSKEVPRMHRFYVGDREIYTVSLTAPSGSANRAIGGMDAYKKIKSEQPDFNTLDFRVMQYRPYFTKRFWEDLS